MVVRGHNLNQQHMIQKINIIKAASILAEIDLLNQYKHMNPSLSEEEVKKLIYRYEDVHQEDGSVINQVIDFKLEAKKQFEDLYKSTFAVLQSCKS